MDEKNRIDKDAAIESINKIVGSENAHIIVAVDLISGDAFIGTHKIDNEEAAKILKMIADNKISKPEVEINNLHYFG